MKMGGEGRGGGYRENSKVKIEGDEHMYSDIVG